MMSTRETCIKKYMLNIYNGLTEKTPTFRVWFMNVTMNNSATSEPPMFISPFPKKAQTPTIDFLNNEDVQRELGVNTTYIDQSSKIFYDMIEVGYFQSSIGELEWLVNA